MNLSLPYSIVFPAGQKTIPICHHSVPCVGKFEEVSAVFGPGLVLRTLFFNEGGILVRSQSGWGSVLDLVLPLPCSSSSWTFQLEIPTSSFHQHLPV